MVFWIPVFAMPVFGFGVGKIGREILFLIIAACFILLSHILFALTDITPYVNVVFLGIGYSLFASTLWPMVALMVPVHHLGTAFGNF